MNRFEHIAFTGVSELTREARPRTHVRNPEAVAGEEGALTSEEAELVEVIFSSAALAVPHYRALPLKRRVAACLRAVKAKSVSEALEKVKANPAFQAASLNAFLIGTTQLYRDTAVFDAIDSTVLPMVLARTPCPRVWSVACSDGSELHTVAALLERRSALRMGALLGSDIRAQAIAAARAGRFSARAIEGLPDALRSLYFKHEGDSFVASPILASKLCWKVEDVLAASPAAHSWDIILCRNFAIYLTPQAASKCWAMIREALRPGGVLVVGKAERPDGFERILPCIYKKK